MRTPILLPLLCSTLLAVPLSAQRVRVHDVPRRPALFATADTNSASAYYIHGVQHLESDPARAAAAFYWAQRLNPRWADAMYARRIALLLADPGRLLRYLEGNRSVIRSPEVQAIDSLYLRALTLDPFLVPKFDQKLINVWLLDMMEDVVAQAGQGRNRALAATLLDQFLSDSRVDPFTRARYAYAEGRYPQALREYERALARARDKSRLRADLGRLHYLSGNYPQALEQLTLAIREMRTEDEREIVFVYESKALLEQSVGAVHEKTGNPAAAREAYGRALTEDLSYYPAHQRLGWLALAAGDTAAALSELALAAEVARDDGAVHYEYALALAAARKYDEAIAALRRAVELEPYFAAPHFALAQLHDAGGRPEALEHYRAFLARCTRDDPQRATVEARLAELAATQ